MERRISAYGSHSLFSVRHISHSCCFSSALRACPFRILCSRRANVYQFLLFSSVRTSLSLGAQAHIDPYPFSSARKRIPVPYFFVLQNSLTYAPAKAKMNVGRGPKRTCPDRYQRQDTPAGANLIVPIAFMGLTGSALPPRSSPRQTTLAAEVLLPLLPPV